ncbi:MAG: hypothetical protein BWK77_08730 [Verrucomicrobia bacterium A1]|nr:MAG: hypothetical protein BWK77_08730 [Verrucomicrobia bacterium A1]
MSVKKIDLQAFGAWVNACVKKHRVHGVQASGDRFVFAPLERAEDLRLDYDVTLLPPKKYFQPPCEVLSKFTRDGTFESVVESEPLVLFGIHPYDMVAISQMDTIFSRDPCDVHYMKRRENATLVVCDVQNASPNVFAGCMGTATVDKGFDVLVTKVDGHYLVDARTDKGRALVELAGAPADADENSLQLREWLWGHNRQLLRKHDLKVSVSVLPKLLERSYEHPVWERKARLCYSCGSCNLVCPTCYCFDVQDHMDWDLQHGKRSRAWDGCMLADFAAVAGGHNFRKDRTERYRHRYYRKGKYVPDMIGEIACVGCGRCVTACTAKIANPVEIFNRLLEEK